MRMDDVQRTGQRLGRETYGVVTSAELAAAGVDPSVVSRLVTSGRWTRLWRGSYLTADHPLGPAVLAQAAVKHAEQAPGRRGPAPPPVVSGFAGARALGMRWVPPGDRVQVLVGPHVQRPSNEHVLVRRTADLADVVPWQWHGVRVADASRIVIDGARECASLRDVRGLLLGAVADGHAEAAALTRLLDHGAVGGTAWARRAVQDAVRGAASPPEAELVDDLVGGGLPFYVNATVTVRGQLVGIIDVYLVGTGVGGEMDSKERHGDAELLDDTLARHGHADAYGLSLVHVTPSRYRADPAAFHARLRAAVAARRRRGHGEPEGLVVTPRGPLLP